MLRRAAFIASQAGSVGATFARRWCCLVFMYRILPIVLLAQPTDLGCVVPAMPGVVAKGGAQCYGLTGIGVEERPTKLLLGHRPQQMDPPSVQPFQQGEWHSDIARARIRQRGPTALVVGFDRW